MHCPRCDKYSGTIYHLASGDTCPFCTTPREERQMDEARAKARRNSPQLEAVLAERMGMTVPEYRESKRKYEHGRLDHYAEEAHE